MEARDFVPLDKIAPLEEFYEESGNFSDQVNRVLSEGGISSEDDKNITASDLFYISESYVSDEGKLSALLKRELGVEDIDSGEVLFKLNKALSFARRYLKEYLRIDLPREIEYMEDFSDIEDVYSFLKKTKGLKKGELGGFSPMYCALATVMAAEWDYIQGDLKNLGEDAALVFDELLEYEGGDEKITKTKKRKDGWSEIKISSEEEELANDVLCSARGKGHYRVIAKMLAKVNFDRKEAINDGIGLRFEIPEDVDIKKLTSFLIGFFKKRFKAIDIKCKNNNLCEENEIEEFKSALDKIDVEFRNRDNRLSDKNYKAFGIEGRLTVDEGRMQPFEVQIVRVGNQNEEGMARHEIYEPLQKISVMSRLFGAVSEEYLDQMVADASAETGISREDIKSYFLEERGVREINVNGRKRYIAGGHIDRMIARGIIPAEEDM